MFHPICIQEEAATVSDPNLNDAVEPVEGEEAAATAEAAEAAPDTVDTDALDDDALDIGAGADYSPLF
jgi:transcription termination/antitermination protein NusG